MAGSDNVGYVYSDPAVSIYQRNNLQAHVNIRHYGKSSGVRTPHPPDQAHPTPVPCGRIDGGPYRQAGDSPSG